MKEKKLFTNERLTVNKKDGLIEATFSFTYKNKVIKRYYFLGHSDDARDIINREKEDGTLLKYAKRYSRKLYWNTSRKMWASCGAVLAAGVIAVGAYFTIQILNSPTENLWPIISVEEAKKIIADFEEKQGLTPEETGGGGITYKINENNLKLFDVLRDNGGQGRIKGDGISKSTIEGETHESKTSYNVPFNFNENNIYFMDPVSQNPSNNNLGDEFTFSGYYLYRDDLPEGNTKTMYFYTDDESGSHIKEGDKPDVCMIAYGFENKDITLDNARKAFEKYYFYNITSNPKIEIDDDSIAALLFGVNTKHITDSMNENNPGILSITDLYFLHPEGLEIEEPFKISEKFKDVCFRSISKNTIQIDITFDVYLQISFAPLVDFTNTTKLKIKVSGKFVNGICVEESLYQNEEIIGEVSGEIVSDNKYVYNGTHSLTFVEVPVPDTADWPLPTPENY